jgi:hypothetical protein
MPPTLTDVLAMAFQLSRSDRDRLRETIESIDHERLREPPAAQKPVAEPPTIEPTITSLRSQKQPKVGNHYTQQEREVLRLAFHRWTNTLLTERQRRQVITETAKQLGRNYEGVYSQLWRMKTAYEKPKPNQTPTP